MQGGAPLATCPACWNFVDPSWSLCPWCGRPLRPSGFAPPPSSFRTHLRVRSVRRWRRTRTGLVLTAIGLLLSWLPLVAAVAALFLSLGSTFLFLGARAAGRRHEVSVVLAFALLTAGGVIIGVAVGSFLLQSYDAAREGLPLRDLRDTASLLIWGTLPGTALIVAGFALQVFHLLPHRERLILVLLSVFLIAAAVGATVLADPELAALDDRFTRGALIADFLLRVSLYRLLEAPSYIGLAILYLTAYWEIDPHAERPARTAPAP